MRQYKVTVDVQYPAYDQRDGIVFYVEALSKAGALKAARRENEIGGQVHREHGRAVWRAEEVR